MRYTICSFFWGVVWFVVPDATLKATPNSSIKSIYLNRLWEDTLRLKSFVPVQQGGLGCFLGYYAAPAGGYVTGNNVYGDREKAQFFSLQALGYATPAELERVLIRVVYKTIAHPDATVQILVYGKSPASSSPGELLAISDPIMLSELPTNGELSSFGFAAPVQLQGDSFFVSLQLPVQSGDTVVLQSTDNGCRQFPHWSWERWADGTWHTLLHSWVLDVDLAIFPVGTFNALVGFEKADDSNWVRVFYSTHEDAIVIQLAKAGQKARMQIRSATGTPCLSDQIISHNPHVLSVRSLPNGIYLVVVETEECRSIHRLAVVR
ncbi:MAG: T9SS type A sorting domain-containing protein [Chitinophagales bacterium]|nr:T9SS type A sorting domain-containing protein [Chitinophagales bacterium]MDW8428303.1 T9SS type A sorting domain-containing protein [Chitinophagales bacterium]